jgi:hypothetical protein
MSDDKKDGKKPKELGNTHLFKMVSDIITRQQKDDADDLNVALRKLKKNKDRGKQMSSNGKLMDMSFKALSIVLTLIIIPTFTWVWDAQGRLSTLELQAGDMDRRLENVEDSLKDALKNPPPSELAVQTGTDVKLLRQELEFVKSQVGKKNK